MEIKDISIKDLSRYAADLLAGTPLGHEFEGENQDILKQIFNAHPHIEMLYRGSYSVVVSELNNGFKTYAIKSGDMISHVKVKDALKGLKIAPTVRLMESLLNAVQYPHNKHIESIAFKYISGADKDKLLSYTHRSYFNKWRICNDYILRDWINFYKQEKLRLKHGIKQRQNICEHGIWNKNSEGDTDHNIPEYSL